MYNAVNTKSTHRDERNDDIYNEEEIEGLNESSRVPKEYAVAQVARLSGQGASIKHVVRWYSYTSAEDIVEPPNNHSQHFIIRYWLSVQRKGRWARSTRGNLKMKETMEV